MYLGKLRRWFWVLPLGFYGFVAAAFSYQFFFNGVSDSMWGMALYTLPSSLISAVVSSQLNSVFHIRDLRFDFLVLLIGGAVQYGAIALWLYWLMRRDPIEGSSVS